MIKYILTNKEWIFSGVGVSAILIIGGFLFKRLWTWTHPSREKSVAVQPKTEAAGIAKRFNQILVLMNENRTSGKHTIASMALRMNLHSIGELESVFLGNREPSFEFIDHFCSCFGVNKDWLIEGKCGPFSNDAPPCYDPLEYFYEIKNSRPERIYFIRSSSPAGETFILLKIADWKYKILRGTWHISDHVGAGGRSQILGMYKLILAIQNSTDLICGGRILNEGQFNKLVEGKVFPGAIIEFHSHENHWWDDFTDIHNQYPISSDYESQYGKGFTSAQNIVRRKLEESAA
jgi:hypothetical protein